MQNKSLVNTFFVIVLSSLLIVEIVDLANDIWGVQLRLFSAIMAENLLNYCGMTTERNFTIITLGSMTFDIIPACNGSESIKAILISAIFLSLINQKLNIIRKLNFFVISILVATLMNGLRISCLISLSAYIGEIIYADSILHTAIGLLFFALSVSILLKINSFLSSNQAIQRKLNFRLLAILTITFTLLPFFYACLRDWKGTNYNNNDSSSVLFFVWGLVSYLYLTKKSYKNHENYKLGLSTVILILVLTCYLQFISPGNYALGFFLIACIHCLNITEFGNKNSIQKSPLLIIIFMGFPKTNEKIMEYLSIDIETVFFLKLLSTLLLSLLVYMKFNPIKYTCTEPIPRISYKLIFGFSCLLVGIQLFGFNNKITDQANEKQYYPYLISDWEGYNLGIEGDEEIRRKYFKGDLSVGLMVVPSKGDRKNIHTPEYCQYGKGWEVDERNSVKFMTENGNLCVTKLELRKNDSRRQFVYWFQCHEISCATYSEFITQDTFLKMKGHKPNWKLCVVWTDQQIDLGKEFITFMPAIY